MDIEEIDVLIIGAGPVGLTLAAALADTPLRIRLVDKKAALTPSGDPRTLAVSYGSYQILNRLNAWPSNASTPIKHIHVSQNHGHSQTLINIADYPIPAFGFVTRYSDLLNTLLKRLSTKNILYGTSATLCTQPSQLGKTLVVSLQNTLGGSNHQSIHAKLVVHADGSSSDSTQFWQHQYAQHAIVCEAKTHEHHQFTAFERFTTNGPLALLPIHDHYAVIQTTPQHKLDALLQLDNETYASQLQLQLPNNIQIQSVTQRHHFPLSLSLKKNITGRRQVWLGNAAQTLHPVSGQGLNLGFRDAWELASLIHTHMTDPGQPHLLTTYSKKRQADRLACAGFTHGLVQIFTPNHPLFHIAREMGLTIAEALPPIKQFIAKRLTWGNRNWP